MLVKPDGADETRLDMFGEKLPDIPATETLHDAWIDLGCANFGFAGPTPLSWVDVAAYSQLTGRALKPCEATCLIEMSRAYVQALNDKNPLSIAPMERQA